MKRNPWIHSTKDRTPFAPSKRACGKHARLFRKPKIRSAARHCDATYCLLVNIQRARPTLSCGYTYIYNERKIGNVLDTLSRYPLIARSECSRPDVAQIGHILESSNIAAVLVLYILALRTRYPAERQRGVATAIGRRHTK